MVKKRKSTGEVEESQSRRDLVERLLEMARCLSRYQQLSRRHTLSVTAGAEKLELTDRDLQIVEALHLGGPMTFDALVSTIDGAVRGASKRSTMSQAVDKLTGKELGLVKKAYNEFGPDKRQPVVSLTPAGTDLATRMAEDGRQVVAKVVEAVYGRGEESKLLAAVAPFRDALGDPTKAHPARIYNYFLGGRFHLPIDELAAAKMEENFNDDTVGGDGLFYRHAMQEHRAFLRRASVLLSSECEIAQYVDVGAGFPTLEGTNIHEIVRRFQQRAVVVAVDKEPAVVKLWTDDTGVGPGRAVIADLVCPQDLLRGIEGIVDFKKPVAVFLAAVLHFVPDDDTASAIISGFRQRMVPGSCFIVSHAYRWSKKGERPSTTTGSDRAAGSYKHFTSVGVRFRKKEELLRWFDDLMPLRGGLTYTSAWGRQIEEPFAKRFLKHDENSLAYGGIFQVPNR